MRILILGYSQIVRKRIIAALLQIEGIDAIDIASLTAGSQVELPQTVRGEIYDDYDAALSSSKADVVYISTINSKHAELAEKALMKGFHVIVDKPAFVEYRDAERLIKFAEQQRRCLAEATVYAYHPQVSAAKDVFSSSKTKPKRLTAIFSFPPFAAGNFRYDKDLGGGALLDLGPYAISVGRVFFEEEPSRIYCKTIAFGGKDNVETAFSVLAVYSGGRSMVGHFGFDTEYRNFINILGENISVEFERVFTIPADHENTLAIKRGNHLQTMKIPRADCFAIYINSVLRDIQNGNYHNHIDNLRADANAMEKLRLAASAGQ